MIVDLSAYVVDPKATATVIEEARSGHSAALSRCHIAPLAGESEGTTASNRSGRSTGCSRLGPSRRAFPRAAARCGCLVAR